MDINSISVTLTFGQILGMYESPVEILAAPGDGLINIIHGFLLNITGVTPYNNGGDIYLQYGNSSGAPGPFASIAIGPGMLLNLSENISNFISGFFNDPVTSALSINQNVCITNDTGAFTDGDVNQTAIVTVWYSVASVQ